VVQVERHSEEVVVGLEVVWDVPEKWKEVVEVQSGYSMVVVVGHALVEVDVLEVVRGWSADWVLALVSVRIFFDRSSG